MRGASLVHLVYSICPVLVSLGHRAQGYVDPMVLCERFPAYCMSATPPLLRDG